LKSVVRRSLIVGKLQDLHLRCLGGLCKLWLGTTVRIAVAFGDGTDPIQEIADRPGRAEGEAAWEESEEVVPEDTTYRIRRVNCIWYVFFLFPSPNRRRLR